MPRRPSSVYHDGVLEAFRARFGRAPTAEGTAPGRVNLIGEHTDYNGGLVLPTAIPARSVVALAPRADGRVRVASASADDDAIAEYRRGAETAGRGWLDYVQGCTVALERDGIAVGGFEAWVASAVPMGSGLASSAALEVSLLRALRAAFALPLDDVALARVAHRAEHDFVGARVGIMDQMAASLADERSALFLDARSLAWERIPLPADADLVVIDSGVAHRHTVGGYNVRRAECEEACRLLGVALLRDLGDGDAARIERLPAPLGRRVRHVLTENARVRAAVDALRAGALARLGELLYASHASLRDDYEVSVPELDLLVELACGERDVHGARLTGGGFGGAVVMLARRGTGATAAARITDAYRERSGKCAITLIGERR